jgi:diguanylate cyclase (GGDEF)-like protein
LKKLALALKNKARRPRDLAARYGGEEFVMLLPHTTLQRAVAIAESIRRAIADWRVPHEDSEGGIVTVSIGAATAIPGQGDAAASLVVAADAAVYRAKAAGRNRVQAA